MAISEIELFGASGTHEAGAVVGAVLQKLLRFRRADDAHPVGHGFGKFFLFFRREPADFLPHQLLVEEIEHRFAAKFRDRCKEAALLVQAAGVEIACS